MPQLYVLYEHASGYGLFHVNEVEEVGALLPSVEKAITDVSLFRSAVKLIAFSPFKSGTNALDNMNAISEGIVHDDLKLFLESNVPTGKKVKKSGGVELGVSDMRISATIQEELGIKCAGGDAVAEIFRGLRLHFANMVKGLNPQGEAKAQLGLGHSYSRAKVKFNVHRADNMIIQSIALLDQLDKDINTFSMRVREWYSYHFPELVRIVNDNFMFCRMVKLIGNRKNLSSADDAFMEKMEEITMDSAKAKAIVDASKMSMGMDISPIDLINIESFSARVISLTEYRKGLVIYLHKRMGSVAPNLASLIGDMVGARLISHAGSLTNLAKYPASTVQILGAEKALFRALKTKGNTPKYGLIFHSTFIGRAEAKNKGRISRFLANKCSIASRIDCFAEQPSNIFGEKLKEQVEERLKFFETGDAPRKNVDVMKEALEEASEFAKNQVNDEEGKGEKKKKKKKKRKSDAAETDISQVVSDGEEATVTPAKRVKVEVEAPTATGTPSEKKKKKKKTVLEEPAESINVSNASVKSEKKKKKKVKVNGSSQEDEADVTAGDATLDNTTMSVDETPKKTKKKKKKANADATADESMMSTPNTTLDDTTVSIGTTPSSKKAKKRKKLVDVTSDDAATPTKNMTDDKKEKKKKSEGLNGSSTTEHDDSQAEVVETSKKAKKKKKKLNSSQDEVTTTGDDSVFEAEPAAKKGKKNKKKKSIAAE